MFMFLQCVGEAVVAKGMRWLLGGIPYGQQIYDVGAEAVERYRQRKREQQIAADLEEVVKAEAEQIREDAARIVQEVASQTSDDVKARLEVYLTQIPSVAIQSLRRPEDATGTTVPKSLHLEDPIQLSAILPQRPPMFKAGDRVPGATGWTLQTMLGSGGFGEVWLGVNSFLHEQRAFKFCLDHAAKDRLLRHEGEVVKRVMQASRNVHANEHGIVPLLDALLEGEAPWLAYEYVEGGDLAGVIRQWERLSLAKRAKYALSTLEPIARVVGELHRLPEPIVHRDLKPANVLLRRTDQGFVFRVTDFGISHVAADQSVRQATVSTPSMTLGETFRGSHTPIYASPQQERGEKADVRDDVHALGVIAYQMIVGDVRAKRPAGKWKKRLAEANLSEDVLELLENCWDDDPDERPKDALAIAERLNARTAPAPSVPKPASNPVPTMRHTSSAPRPRPGDILEGALGMKFARVPAGRFWMGGGDGQRGERECIIPEPFYLGVYPVTQGEWKAIQGNSPGAFSRVGHCKSNVRNLTNEQLSRFPVENVSLQRVEEFLIRLNEQERDRGLIYRLPTEEEWEYACRGGGTSAELYGVTDPWSYSYYFDVPTNELGSYRANFRWSKAKGGSLERPCEVGLYKPNCLGLYDMHGNVWEWTSSLYEGGPAHVMRGGCWRFRAEYCQASTRFRDREEDLRSGYVGLRLLAEDRRE